MYKPHSLLEAQTSTSYMQAATQSLVRSLMFICAYTAHCTPIGCNEKITQAEHTVFNTTQALEDTQHRLNKTHRTNGAIFYDATDQVL